MTDSPEILIRHLKLRRATIELGWDRGGGRRRKVRVRVLKVIRNDGVIGIGVNGDLLMLGLERIMKGGR